MITYNAKNITLNSKYKSYKLSDITCSQMYEWSVTKQISLKDFTQWVEAQASAAYSEGLKSQDNS